MNKEKLIEQTTRILENFDFSKVQAYMTLTKWEWWNGNEGLYYKPSIDELKETATSLLARAIDSELEATSIGIGGFNVYKFNFGLRLTFEPFYKAGY